jgi:pyruvate formate lyase activating enzyme
MREASYWKILKRDIVQCTLCPHFCTLKNNETGKCNVRKNVNGKLYTLIYGKPVSLAIDPIEKKPLFHFLPGSKVFSFGTYGCNFDCKNCQNSDISRGKSDESLPYIEPEEIVKKAIETGCKSIAYTYTEPTIFYEYMLDVAKLAKKKKLKNVIVTNGFINKEPLKELMPFIDAANIDLKGNNKHYKNVCMGRLEPILETIKSMHNAGIFIEVTNLIIPKLNDLDKDIQEICDFMASLSKDIPLHFSAFYPSYNLLYLPSTSKESLLKARELAVKSGLKYVYLGNISGTYEDTICPKCRKTVIKRRGFFVGENKMKGEGCPFCNQKICGVWK